jgi:Txe/YoeB family toxin of toxin-antitoxin system
MYKLLYTRFAQKDAKKIAQSGLKNKCQELLKIIKNNPYKNPPAYKKLEGDLKGRMSRRINLQHRLVYEVFEKEKVVKILGMWSHYGE